jgi:hypothetical protein
MGGKMLIGVTTLELRLLQECNQLQFGTFRPYEPKPIDNEVHQVRAHPTQLKLVEYIRKWGLPTEISIRDGFPQWAIFEIKFETGLGYKRIQLN